MGERIDKEWMSLVRCCLCLLFFYPGFLFSEAIYNFPDLEGDIAPDEAPDSMEKLAERDYLLLTNEQFYNLFKAAGTRPALRDALQSIYLREYFTHGSEVFSLDTIEYNYRRKLLLSRIRDSLKFYFSKSTKDGKFNIGVTFGGIDTHLSLTGEQSITFKYGTARYLVYKKSPQAGYNLNRDYFNFFDAELESARFFDRGLISDGFNVDQNLNIHLQGRVGRKIEVELKYNSVSRENTYRIEYVGDPREFVSRIRFGRVNLNVGQKSHFLTTGGSSKNATGIRMDGRKGNFSMSASLSLTRGISEVYTRAAGTETIRDIDYFRRRFFLLPDEDVEEIDHQLYRQLTGISISNATLTIVNVREGTQQTLYFARVDKSLYTVEQTRGRVKVDMQGIQVIDRYLLFFYAIKSQGEAAFRPGAAMNSSVFLGERQSYDRSNIPLTSDHSLAVLTAPASILNDENLEHDYELRNHYPISRNTDINRLHIEIRNTRGELIDPLIWYGSERHIFVGAREAEVRIDEGYFFFEAERPLVAYTNHYLDEYGRGFYDYRNPTSEENRINFLVESSGEEIDFVDLERFNLIPNSVVVIRGGRRLDKKEYRVNYYTGRVYFNEKQKLLKGEKIEIHYEYRPFGSSLQKVLLASRFDYVFRGKSYIGGTLAFSSGQDTLSAPLLGNEVAQQFIMNVDTHLELISLFQKRRYTDLSLNLDMEYAFSLQDKNKKSLAIIEDMERDQSFSLPKSFANYYQSANPHLDQNRLLGRSYFVDFSSYLLTGSRSAVEFTLSEEQEMLRNTSDGAIRRQDVNFRPYAVHPGPFQVTREGHLHPNDYPNQSILVYDFDFDTGPGRSELSYVSFLVPVGSARSVNLSRFNRLEVIYKLLPSYDVGNRTIRSEAGTIGFSIDAGNLNEDLDLDGRRDEEGSQADINGFEFNYQKGDYENQTRIGSGFKGFFRPEEITIGNGRLDREDRNEDGLFITPTQERRETYPSRTTVGEEAGEEYFRLFSEAYLRDHPDAQALADGTGSLNGAFYERIRNRSLNPDDPYQRDSYYKLVVPLREIVTNNTLQNVVYLRLNLIELNETLGKRGRLIIEDIRFKGDAWNRTRIDGLVLARPPQFQAAIIGTEDDEHYQENHLARFYRKEYEDLHGSLLFNEFDKIRERAMAVTYRLNGVLNTDGNDRNGRLGLAERIDTTPRDMSFYKIMKFYLFVREQENPDGADFIYRFGRDERNYYELRIPLNRIADDGAWKEYTIRFKAAFPHQQPAFRRAYGGNRDPDHVFKLEGRSTRNRSGRFRLSVIGRDRPQTIPKEDYTIRIIGSPSLKKIQYLATGVEKARGLGSATSGTFLLNEIAAGEDEVLFGHAYRMGLSFSKEKPIGYKNFNILSDLRVGFDYTYQGVNFSSLDLAGREGHDENLNLTGGFRLFDMFRFEFDAAKDYFLSDFREQILSREDQSLNIGDSFKIDMGLTLPKLAGQIVPDIDAVIQKNRRNTITFREFAVGEFIPQASRREIIAEQRVEESRSYVFGESKTYAFTRNIRFDQSYRITTDYTRSEILTNRLFLEKADIISDSTRDLYGFFLRIDKQEDVNPILSDFPEVSRPITEKSSFLQRVVYSFSREHEFGLGLDLWDFSWNFKYSESYRYSLQLTNDFAGPEAREASRLLDDGGPLKDAEHAFASPFNRLPGAFFDRKRYRYSAGIKYGSRIPLGLIQINRLSVAFNYTYEEANFQENVTRTVSLSEFSRLIDPAIASRIAAYFAEPHDYRDIKNVVSWDINLPIRFLHPQKKNRPPPFFIDGLPRFQLSRQVSYTDEEVINEDIGGLFGSGVDPGRIGIVGKGSRSGFGRESLSFQTEYLNLMQKMIFLDWEKRRGFFDNLDRISPYLSLPVFDYFFYFIYWLFKGPPGRSFSVEDYREMWMFRDRQRIRIAEVMDRSVNSFYRREDGSKGIDKVTIHERFSTRVEQLDKFNLEFSFRKYDNFLDYFMPDRFTYSGELRTAKIDHRLEQSEETRFSIQKEFTKLNDVITRALPPGKGFQRQFRFLCGYNYNQKRDFNIKEFTRTHSLTFGTTFLRVTRRMDFSFNYRGSYIENVQAYRFQYLPGNLPNSSPYLGIGREARHRVESSYPGSRAEYLNVGRNEAYRHLSRVEDLGTERSDYIQFEHDLVFSFQWRQGKIRQVKVGKKTWTLPRIQEQKLDFFINIVDYRLFNIDALRLGQGRIRTEDWEGNPLAWKNINFYYNTLGNDRDIKLWSSSTVYRNTISLNRKNNFTMTFRITLALIGVANAPTYAAYRKVKTRDTSFLRRTDYVQVGLDMAITAALRF